MKMLNSTTDVATAMPDSASAVAIPVVTEATTGFSPIGVLDSASAVAMPVVTPEEMAAIDEDAIAELSHEHSKPLEVLISRAGEAVAVKARQMLVERCGQCYGRRVLVLAGKGNNGKDGKEAARRLRNWGVQVLVVDIAARLADSPETEAHETDTHEADSPNADTGKTDLHEIANYPGPTFQVELPKSLPKSFLPIDLIIDAACGTGLSRPYELPEFIRTLSKGIPVLAVDIPSGVSGLTGQVLGEALPAAATVTFGAYKPGLLFGEGKTLSGEVEVASIGLDASGVKTHLLTADNLAALLPKRDANAHKWNAACWVVGGSPGMTGAPSLAASAAYRAGAGYVRVSTPAAPSISSDSAEIEAVPSPANKAAISEVREAVGFALPKNCWSEAVLQASGKFHSLVVGPGLAASQETRESVQQLLASEAVTSGRLAMVIDGGALEALGQRLLGTPLKETSLKTAPLKPASPGVQAQQDSAAKQDGATPQGDAAQRDGAVPQGGATPQGDAAQQDSAVPQSNAAPQVVLTPHDREYAYLSGSPPEDDRIAAARQLAAATGAVVLLKGPTTVVSHPDGSVLLSAAGDQRLATAGTGDVLAGIIGALLAQGLDAFQAAALGAEWHSRAARLGSASGLLASDICDLLPQVLQKLCQTQMT